MTGPFQNQTHVYLAIRWFHCSSVRVFRSICTVQWIPCGYRTPEVWDYFCLNFKWYSSLGRPFANQARANLAIAVHFYLPGTTCSALYSVELTRKRDHATFDDLHRVSVLRNVTQVRERLVVNDVSGRLSRIGYLLALSWRETRVDFLLLDWQNRFRWNNLKITQNSA
jgi:hypothetical protein